MKTALKILILLPIALLILAFALANRSIVTVSFDAFGAIPDAAAAAPLFVVLFVAVMIGIVVGGAASWLTQGRHRRAARQHRQEAERLHAEVTQLRGNAGEQRGALMRLVAGGRGG